MSTNTSPDWKVQLCFSYWYSHCFAPNKTDPQVSGATFFFLRGRKHDCCLATWMTYPCRGVARSLCRASPQVDDVHLLRKADRSPARTAWQRREALQRGLHRVSNADGQQLTRAAGQRTYGDRGLAQDSTLEKSKSVGMKRCDKPHSRWELLPSVCGSRTFPLYQTAKSNFSFETDTVLVLSWIVIHPDEEEGFSVWNLMLYNKVLSVSVMNLFHTASCYKM